MPFPWAAFMAGGMAGSSAAGGVYANKMNRTIAHETNAANVANSREQMAFQERMSNTAYQRAKQDMLAAGFNPGLMYSQGGASTPTGSMAASVGSKEENVLAGAASGAMDFMRTRAELKNVDASTANLKAQTELNSASAKEARTREQMMHTTKGKEEFWSKIYQHGLGGLSTAKKIWDAPAKWLEKKGYVSFDNVGNSTSKKNWAVKKDGTVEIYTGGKK